MFLMKNVINHYLITPPSKKIRFNRVLNRLVKNLRVYYTLPLKKDHSREIDRSFFSLNEKNFEILDDCIVGEMLGKYTFCCWIYSLLAKSNFYILLSFFFH